jgi:hypothetical protein
VVGNHWAEMTTGPSLFFFTSSPSFIPSGRKKSCGWERGAVGFGPICPSDLDASLVVEAASVVKLDRSQLRRVSQGKLASRIGFVGHNKNS